jgi:hypothetical protein
MKPSPAKPRSSIAQVEGSGTAGATAAIEKVFPLVSVKKAKGSWKSEADENICKFALCSLAVRALPKSKVITSPSDDLLALVARTPFAPDPPQLDIPHSFTDA